VTEKSVWIKRGKRLQNLRNKIGLTRSAFAEQTGISANTLKAIELGERELTAAKARLYSNLFHGLFSTSLGEDAHEASFEYLYQGKNPEEVNHALNHIEDVQIQNEINFFITNPAYIFLKIQDDLMAPFYNPGDIVVGKKVVNKNQFPIYQGAICIIEPATGDKLLRRIIKSNNRKITACLLNPHGNTNILEELEVNAIAQATRHWHLSELK